MRTLVFLLILLPAVAGPAAAGPPGPAFEVRLVAAVFGTAFDFILSRALEPTTLEQLALSGLRGVTTLDDTLAVDRRDGSLDLRQRDRSVFQRGVPMEQTGAAWGAALADVASAAWDASEPMRAAGTQTVISAMFGEALRDLDPYSRYVPPSLAANDRARRSGDAGAGIQIERVRDELVVRSVNADGPGAEAGIAPGDRVVAVDDQPTRGESLDTVNAWIAGVEGTAVTLTLRGRDGRTRVAEVERAVVPPETVFFQRVGTLALIRVTGFSTDTDRRLSHEMERVIQSAGAGARGMVLDLRGNRGGLLRQAVAAADLLLETGLVSRTEGRNPNARHEFRATAGDITGGRPVVVLVDGRSASAAEIVAAALADHGRAVVVGSATLGKGLVQTIATLPNGGELFVSWSRMLGPGGWPIQGLGLLPQVCTSLGADALARQLASLNRGTSRMADALARHRAARAPLSAADTARLRAPCPAAEGSDADLRAARALLGSPKAYAAALIAPPP